MCKKKLLCVIGCGVMLWVQCAGAGAPVIDHYISTGDNHFLATSLPIEDANAINATFDLLTDVWGARRIYWRGLQQMQSYRPGAQAHLIREGVHPRLASFKEFNDYLINDMQIEQIALQAAHARGIELWGVGNLYDWGGPADTAVNAYYGYPYPHQSQLTVSHPHWMPVDKYGVVRQAGPFEMAYPEARQAFVNAYVDLISDVGYDGVAFLTYAENYGMRYQDQFGYSDPIVEEFKNRYGVDIRTESFNRNDWISLRGEYTTQFLSELKTALSPYGIQLAMPLYSTDPGLTRDWPYATGVRTAGDIKMDYPTWASNGIVDALFIEGSNSTLALSVAQEVTGSGVEVGMMTSNPYSFTHLDIPLISMLGEETTYLLRSQIPPQPLSALSDTDPYKRMRVLAQIIAGDTPASVSAVLPAASDAHLLVRRLAMRAIGKIGDPAGLSTLEAGVFDTESAVRNGAIIGLQTMALEGFMGPSTAAVILNAVDQHGNFMFNDAAAATLPRCVPYADTRALLADTMQNHSNPMVRETAIHAFSRYMAHIDYVSAFTNVLDNDPCLNVRLYAIQGLGNISGSVSAVMRLVSATASGDVAMSQRAVQALAQKPDNPAAIARKSAIIDALTDLFITLADPDCQRSDVGWGYRPIGDALLAYAPEGPAALQAFYEQQDNPRLAQMAWMALSMPQDSGDFTPMTEPEYEAVFEQRPLIFDKADMTGFLNEWLIVDADCTLDLQYDLNQDCRVNLVDLAVIARNWVEQKWP